MPNIVNVVTPTPAGFAPLVAPRPSDPHKVEGVARTVAEKKSMVHSAKTDAKPDISFPLDVTVRDGGSPAGETSENNSAHLIYRNNTFTTGNRTLADETAVAISYNGSTHAVLMATPQDLTDFAIGFSLTEGIVSGKETIENIELVETALGFDVQLRLAGDVAEKLAARKRSMAGPVGCGLCGIESLEAAMRPVPMVVSNHQLTPQDIVSAAMDMSANQPINAQTRAVHAAGFYVPGQGLIAVREDVGRHNALDKLIGALMQKGVDPALGSIVLTSRVSVEMVQKSALFGCSVIIAVSAPTALAVKTADDAGISLVAVVRGHEFEVFTHSWRIETGAQINVA